MRLPFCKTACGHPAEGTFEPVTKRLVCEFRATWRGKVTTVAATTAKEALATAVAFWGVRPRHAWAVTVERGMVLL